MSAIMTVIALFVVLFVILMLIILGKVTVDTFGVVGLLTCIAISGGFSYYYARMQKKYFAWHKKKYGWDPRDRK